FKKILHGLTPDFNASIFIFWHMSLMFREYCHRFSTVSITYMLHMLMMARKIKPNRIYIAQPDHHLLIRNGKVRITHGPKENRFRPAVDPLFRSAAYTYTDRVIGVILSGALDDGTAGLWTVKHYGGIAIVQDPVDAEVSSMPRN